MKAFETKAVVGDVYRHYLDENSYRVLAICSDVIEAGEKVVFERADVDQTDFTWCISRSLFEGAVDGVPRFRLEKAKDDSVVEEDAEET